MKQFTWCLALFPAAAAAFADDWPQWQGPDQTAVSKEKGLLQEWPKDGPSLAWKALRLVPNALFVRIVGPKQ